MLEGVVLQLSDLQINLVVEQYLKEMARHEAAARHVEQRLRRELRGAC